MERIRTSVVQIFNKEVFWLFLPWMCSLLDAVYERSTFPQITGSNDAIFMNNRLYFVVLGEIFISPELFFV